MVILPVTKGGHVANRWFRITDGPDSPGAFNMASKKADLTFTVVEVDINDVTKIVGEPFAINVLDSPSKGKDIREDRRIFKGYTELNNRLTPVTIGYNYDKWGYLQAHVS